MQIFFTSILILTCIIPLQLYSTWSNVSGGACSFISLGATIAYKLIPSRLAISCSTNTKSEAQSYCNQHFKNAIIAPPWRNFYYSEYYPFWRVYRSWHCLLLRPDPVWVVLSLQCQTCLYYLSSGLRLAPSVIPSLHYFRCLQHQWLQHQKYGTISWRAM